MVEEMSTEISNKDVLKSYIREDDYTGILCRQEYGSRYKYHEYVILNPSETKILKSDNLSCCVTNIVDSYPWGMSGIHKQGVSRSFRTMKSCIVVGECILYNNCNSDVLILVVQLT